MEKLSKKLEISIPTTMEMFPDFPLNYYARSPLRYPGGKSRAIKTILPLVPRNTKSICSPFVGGASLELALAANGIKVNAYDIFSPLVTFWQCALKNSAKLAKMVENYFPLSKQSFYSLQKNHINFSSTWEKAATFFVLNRASFSGASLSGGMSPGHPRFTRSAIERLRKFQSKNFTVKKSDYRESIANHEDSFLYLDPPYMNGQKLYGFKGDTHARFDHQALRDILKERDGWILSYNDCPTIRDWYSDYIILVPAWQYGMGNSKNSKEIIILSHDIKTAA